MKYKNGDEVIIIKRKINNHTGLLDYNKPNGDVGRICKLSIKDGKYRLNTYINGKENYVGYFDVDDFELVNKEIKYEIY